MINIPEIERIAKQRRLPSCHEVLEMTQLIRELAGAAQSVVKHWDTPAWKYEQHTGEVIAGLRVALEKARQAGATDHVEGVRHMVQDHLPDAGKMVAELSARAERAEAEVVEISRVFDVIQNAYYESQQKIIHLEEIVRLYNEALRQEPVGWVIWHAGTSVYSFGSEKPLFNLAGSEVLPRYAGPVPRTVKDAFEFLSRAACNHGFVDVLVHFADWVVGVTPEARQALSDAAVPRKEDCSEVAVPDGYVSVASVREMLNAGRIKPRTYYLKDSEIDAYLIAAAPK